MSSEAGLYCYVSFFMPRSFMGYLDNILVTRSRRTVQPLVNQAA